ncbi:sterol carrier family protein [uncultured Dietzia sp.]|uniref:sterol carrier family protein n=1 Tax=uncultured Dietzia sp. TaxID=395519 RepID=UPI0025DAACF1|nr:sterol carrier family protein [uncultured Dietzia sp.]
MSRVPDAAQVRAAVEAVREWLDDDADVGEADTVAVPTPGRSALAAAVRGTVGILAAELPGHAVEVRVPPFAAAQCVEGPRHTRGSPPNVVETDARTWLLLATGRLDWDAAVDSGRVRASGTRASAVAAGLPVVRTA